MKKISSRWLPIFIAMVLVGLSQSVGAQKYAVILIGPGTPYAINNNGIVVGAYRTDSAHYCDRIHGFSWQNGQITDLKAFAGWSRAYAVNSAGLIVGYSETVACSPNNVHAFSWIDHVMNDLGTLGGSGSSANDVNDSGVIVGEATLPDGRHHSVIWLPGDRIMAIGALSGVSTIANAINNKNVVVGISCESGGTDFHPFLWDNWQYSELGTLDGRFGWPTDINDLGQVVGYSHASGTTTDHAVMWHNGIMVDLGG